MRKTQEESGTRLIMCGKAVLLGGGVAFAVCVGVLLLFAAAVSRGMLGAHLRYQLTVISCVFGSFAGGLWAARHAPAKGILSGLAAGTVLFLLLLTLGLLIYDTVTLENGAVGLLCACLCGGATAGILSGGGNRNRRKTTGRKKRRGGR